MKKIFLIGGTMGVGKTSVGQYLKSSLDNSVYLDGDWCWDARPFHVTTETKKMVINNICFLLNSFINCSVYENIIFSWVMHQQSIIDAIISRLDTRQCDIKAISLITDEATLKNRLMADIEKGLRNKDIISRSTGRIALYNELNTIKINTVNKSIQTIAEEIMAL